MVVFLIFWVLEVAVEVVVADFLTVTGLDVLLKDVDALALVATSEKCHPFHRNMWHCFYCQDLAPFRLALYHHISANQKKTRL